MDDIQRYLPVLSSCVLFSGLKTPEILWLNRCCHGNIRRYGKGEFLFHAGERYRDIGIVLEGTVDAVEYTADGEELPAGRQQSGGVFGDLLAAAGEASPVSLRTPEGAVVLLLSVDAVLGGCQRQCPCHLHLRRNLLQETSSKFWELRRQAEILRTPRLRQKVLLFLRRQPQKDGYITLPYSREEMARLLNVDRTALSRELSRMKDEKIIDYHLNSFRIL